MSPVQLSNLSQFVACPTTAHWKVAMHVLRYLKGCPSLGVFYYAHCDFHLHSYSDVDWVTCVDTRRSLTGYCNFLERGLLLWKRKKQPIVVASSVEAEYKALSLTTRELILLTHLLQEFKVSVSLPISLYYDDLAAIHITKNHVYHERTKHVDIDCHIVREQYVGGFLCQVAESSHHQLADFSPNLMFLLIFLIYCPRWVCLMSTYSILRSAGRENEGTKEKKIEEGAN